MLVVEGALGSAVMARLRERNVSRGDLATQLGLTLARLDGYLTGAWSLSSEVAEGLSRVLGGELDEWLQLAGVGAQTSDRPENAWLQAAAEFRSETLKVLRDRGLVTATARKSQREQLARELEAFFRCAPDQVAKLVPASFKQSTAHPAARDAVDVWLKLADEQANLVVELEGVPSLDKGGLRSLLPDLLKVGDQQPEDYLDTVKQRLADVGVALVFQPDVPGTRLSGASWPTDQGHGVLATTLRHRTDDWFWWTLFHECAHLLLAHGLVLDTVDAEDYRGQQEQAADELARELLLPPEWSDGLTKVSGDRVRARARDLGVPAGVLVGQLQKRRNMQPHWLRPLKKAMPETATLEVDQLTRLSSPAGSAWQEGLADLSRGVPHQP